MSPQAQLLFTGAIEVILTLMLGWCGYRVWKRRSTGRIVSNDVGADYERRINAELLHQLVRMVAEHTRSVESFQSSIEGAEFHRSTPVVSAASADSHVLSMRKANRHFDRQAEGKSVELALATRGNPVLFGQVSSTFSDHRQRTTNFDDVLGQVPAGSTLGQLQQVTSTALREVLETTRRLEGELSAAHQQIDLQAEKLRAAVHDARIDPLTRIPNRRAFEEYLVGVHCMYERQGTVYSILMVDIDKFKSFNDTCGHAAGDAVLQVTAKVLQSQLRLSDRVFRFGGEEFVMVLAATGARQAVIVAERARKRVEASIVHFDGQELRVTVSIGVAEIRANESSSALLEQADMALYAAKEAGRNRVEVSSIDRVNMVDASPEALA